MFTINNVLETSPDEPLTESDVTPVSGESSDVIKHLLAKPFKFTYVCILLLRSRQQNKLSDIRELNMHLLAATEA